MATPLTDAHAGDRGDLIALCVLLEESHARLLAALENLAALQWPANFWPGNINEVRAAIIAAKELKNG